MSSQITTYTIDYINEIESRFKAVLDEDIIKRLQEIKNNITFYKYVNPIEIKYKLDSNKKELGNISNPDIIITEAVINSRIVSNLNKLTIKNYDNILDIITNIIKDSNKEEIRESLFIDIIFNKATEEIMYSNLYARLTADIIRNFENKNSLNNYLQDICQNFFNSNIKNDITNIDNNLEYNVICKINKNKTLLLGGIAFICNLYNFDLISVDYVIKYYQSLEKIIENDIDNINIYIDTFSSIINTCGKKLFNYNKKEFYNTFLKIIADLSKDRKRIKAKNRFKLQDILDKCKDYTN